MKKWIAFCLAAALAAGLCACKIQMEERTTTPAPSQTAAEEQKTAKPASATENASGFLITDEATCPEFLETLAVYKSAGEYQPIANSFIKQKQLCYKGLFYQVQYAAWPDFRDEIAGPGAESIKAFYRAAYEKPLFVDFDWLDQSEQDAEELIGEPYHCNLQVYAVARTDLYLSVDFFTYFYGGGAHGYGGNVSDVFSLQTGKKLEFDDIVQVSSAYGIINALAEEYLRANDIDIFEEPFDIRETPASSFRMTQEGPVLIFNPYEIAPYAAGIIEIPIPFSALEG